MKSKFERFSPEWWEWMTVPEPNTGCVLWTGSVCKNGYGRLASTAAGSPVLAHRIALARALGRPVSSSIKVLHRCDTPSCVNPDHLFLGTQQDNMRDMFTKGRANPRGHKHRRVSVVLATVAVRELASQDSHTSVRIADELHLMRTSAMSAGWRHVTGVPSWAQHHDGPACVWPLFRTAEPAKSNDAGYRPVATVAPECALGLPPYVADPFTAQPARVGGVE